MVLLGVRMDVEDVSRTATGVAKAKKLIGSATDAQSAEQALASTMKRIRGFIDRMADSSFAARAATTQELAWSLRHDLRRTVDWVPATAMATGGQVARLRSAQVVPAAEHVEITTDTGTRYLQMVIPTETGFPHSDLEIPGGEWLKKLDVLRGDEDDDPAPAAEVSIRGRNVPRIEALKILRDAFALTKEQKRTAAEGVAQEVPDAIADSSEALRERIREIQTGAVGMVEDTPCWIVEADNLADLEDRTSRLVDFYGGMGISLWAPPEHPGPAVEGDGDRRQTPGHRVHSVPAHFHPGRGLVSRRLPVRHQPRLLPGPQRGIHARPGPQPPVRRAAGRPQGHLGVFGRLRVR